MTEELRKKVAKLHDTEEYQVFYRSLGEKDTARWYEEHKPSAEWDWGANEYRIYVATNDLPILLNSYSIYYYNHEFFFMDVDPENGSSVVRKIIADEIFPYEAEIITNKADTHIEGSLSVDNDLSVTGNTRATGSLSVTGESTFNDSVNVKDLSSIKVNGVPVQNSFVNNVSQKDNGAISYTLGGLEENHDVTVYTHHAQTALTGKPEKNATPEFGDIVTVSQPIVDAEGHTTALNDKTIQIPYNTATQEKDGLMSSEDKTLLDGVETLISDKVAAIVANAPEDLDTLKEISDWITDHADDAAAMNSQIASNGNEISSLKTSVSNCYTKDEINEKLASLESGTIAATESLVIPTSEPEDLVNGSIWVG